MNKFVAEGKFNLNGGSLSYFTFNGHFSEIFLNKAVLVPEKRSTLLRLTPKRLQTSPVPSPRSRAAMIRCRKS